MLHKGFVLCAAAAGLWVTAKTTNFGSYAGTLWSQARSEAKRHISTKFEIERARHEVTQLDKDVSGMIRPIAEYKAALLQLDKDIRRGETNIDERREALLRLTRELEKSPTTLTLAGRAVTLEKAKSSLARDFESFQRLERHIDSLHKLRDAKQLAFEAAQEQLSKVIAKKREFEVRLAQLEADEETLKIAGLGNKMAVDDNRASAIEAALADIESRQNVRRVELELASGEFVSETSPRRETFDLSGIKSYLEKTP